MYALGGISASDGSDVLDGLKVFEVLEVPDGHKAADGLCMVLIT